VKGIGKQNVLQYRKLKKALPYSQDNAVINYHSFVLTKT
jgi:hypothetical protein